MEVAAVVPVKLKRRKVSAVRDFPKGCGRNAPPIPPKQPIEQPDLPVKAAEAEEVPRSDVPNGMPALAPASTEAVLPAEAEKPADVEVPSGPGAPATESKEEEEVAAEVKGTTAPEVQAVVVVMKAEANGDEGLPEQAVKLEVLELSNGCLDQPDVLMGSSDQPDVLMGSSDQPELLAMVTRVDVSVKQCYSKKYPPPKRREVSAVRDFPAGCGRGVPLMIREGILEVAAAVDDSSMRKTLDVVKEPAVSSQLAAEGSVEIAPTKKAEMEVKKDKPKKIQVNLGETDGGARMKPTSASLKSKSLDGEKKPAAQELIVPEDYVEEVTPNGKAEMEMKKDESKKSRVDPRETSSQGRVKSVSASLKSNSMDGKRLAVKKLSVMEGSVRVASTKKAQGNTEQVREQAQEISSEVRVKSTEERNEKKTDVRYVKPVGKSLAIKEAQESKPSLDSRFHSGSKSVVKSGISSVGKSLDKGFIKQQTDAKVLKRKFSEEAESRGRVTNNQTEGDLALEAYGDRMIVQALMAAQNCPWGQGRMSGGFSSRSVAQKNVKREQKSSSKHSAFKGASVSRLKNEASTEDEEDSVHQDEENSKALTVYNKQHEWSVNVTPLVPPKPHRKGGENDEISDRNKVKRALRLFQLLCRKLLQGEESKSKDLGRVHRVDLKASAVLKENNEWVNSGKPIIGHVPGVEVGDEFHYRVELSIVGLHRPFQGGIDYTKKNGMVLATSIVASGGYPDDIDSSDVLVYSGSGGNPAGGDKQGGDQKLERGNLSLKNCIDAETPVRVIYGFKVKGNEHDAKAKTITTFTYDGLYVVEKYWSEKGPRGFSVFKFQLRRMAGQPELALKEVKRSKKAKVREGLCIKDITEGKENMPICAVNTIDDDRPMPFKYITKNIYPSWYVHTPSRGCDCTDGCLDSEKCACAVKNGGEIPFNYNGAIVQAKPLVYECGPSCNCPPSCYNRVSQHGIKIPLEIFKTKSRGWGVRSLYSIPSGTFICEYIGELLKDSDAEQRSNDEYLFDIGHNYEDKTLWEGLPTLISGLQSSSVCETLDDAGFTIDAAEFGNVGRFINHSCSPNIYAQNVLYDHDDKRMPHIMFFAADNIPPLQELTYHYNYTVDQVRDSEGNIKRKNCCCGAPECTGRLY